MSWSEADKTGWADILQLPTMQKLLEQLAQTRDDAADIRTLKAPYTEVAVHEALAKVQTIDMVLGMIERPWD